VLGLIAAVLIPLAIVDMVESLPLMPEAWWRPPDEAGLAPGQFDLRMMIICPGPRGWLGTWGYLISLVWVPIAAYQTWRGLRAGLVLSPVERILLVLVPTLIVIVQLLLRLTPLGYAYPLV
jgi:hypothetical protein